MTLTGIVIRPYSQFFDIMSELLTQCQVVIKDKIPKNKSLNEILSYFDNLPHLPEVILIPFSLTRDKSGKEIHGLIIHQALIKRFPNLKQAKWIMPVSQFAAAAFWGKSTSYDTSNILILEHEEIKNKEELLQKIKAYIQAEGHPV